MDRLILEKWQAAAISRQTKLAAIDQELAAAREKADRIPVFTGSLFSKASRMNWRAERGALDRDISRFCLLSKNVGDSRKAVAAEFEVTAHEVARAVITQTEGVKSFDEQIAPLTAKIRPLSQIEGMLTDMLRICSKTSNRIMEQSLTTYEANRIWSETAQATESVKQKLIAIDVLVNDFSQNFPSSDGSWDIKVDWSDVRGNLESERIKIPTILPQLDFYVDDLQSQLTVFGNIRQNLTMLLTLVEQEDKRLSNERLKLCQGKSDLVKAAIRNEVGENAENRPARVEILDYVSKQQPSYFL